MRRTVILAALVVTLIVVDAVANDLRFTTDVQAEIQAFARLVTQFIRRSVNLSG